MKRFLYVFRYPPYGSSMGQEALDAVIVAPAFDVIEPAVLFMDDGVFQVKKQQAASMLCAKQYTNAFSVLEDFGIEKVYVHLSSLKRRGLTEADLMIEAQCLDDAELRDLFHQQHRIFNF